MSRSRTPQEALRRRKALLIITVAVLVLIGWIAVVAALSGQSPSAGGSGQGQTPEGGSAAGEQASGNDPSAAGGDDPDGEAESVSGEPGGGGSGGPSEQEMEKAADEMLSQPPGGGPPEGEVPIEDEEGRSNGQRGFVASFVGAAYGYTGKDPEEYRAGYENRIDTSTYYDSEGGKVLEEYAAMVEDGGAENAATLEDYRITSGEPVETKVNAAEVKKFAPPQVMEEEIPEGATVSEVTYAVGDRYGDPSKDEDFGQVYGDVDYLKQRLFLSRAEGSGWTILAASAPQPTEDPDAGEPAPDEPKVGYEPPGGHGHGDAHGHEHGAS